MTDNLQAPSLRFLVCVHDASPAYASETRVMLEDLAPLVATNLSLAVVPDWNNEWPLTSHRDYCRLIRDESAELLLHGFTHRRAKGRGPVSYLAETSDEMNGLNPRETRDRLQRGQNMFAEVFGKPARGFLAPAWQKGNVAISDSTTEGLDYTLGFFSLESADGKRIPLSTWTWDCGRWGWLGRIGHGIGQLSRAVDRGVPTLAIHPRDIERGYWPKILRLIRELLDEGYEPTTPSRLHDG